MAQYYKSRLETFGIYSPLAVSWNTLESQKLRFKILTKIIPDQQKQYTLLDVGCGLGDYLDYLQEAGYNNINYTGLDLMPEMIAGAKKKKHQNKFIQGNFLEQIELEQADLIISSGTLNIMTVPRFEHKKIIEKFIVKAYALAKLGFAFNLLSRHGEQDFERDENFYYADPDDIFEYCKKSCPNTKIDHSYLKHDFTIFMRKI